MTITVFTRGPGSIYSKSTEALIAYLDLDVDLVFMDYDVPNPLFLAHFPANNHYYPALYDSKTGLAINQSVAVNRYLLSLASNHKGLLGNGFGDEAQILQWTNRIDSGVTSKIINFVVRRISGSPYTPEEAKAVIENFDYRSLDLLETHLKTNKFILGDKLSLAEIESGGLLSALALENADEMPHLVDLVNQFGGNAEWRQKYPNVLRWLNDVHQSEPYLLQTSVPRDITDF